MKKELKLSIFLASASFLFFACGTDKQSKEENQTEPVDSNKTTLIEIEGKVFSIPSPIQTAILIQQTGSTYDASILNSPKNATKYSTNFQKAINLGVYGADLGYTTIYSQTQDGISYLTAVNKLSDELGISGTFSKELMKRFERNMGIQDSLLAMVSDAYQEADAFLKNNERNDISALVLAGGWIETLWFAVNVAEKNKNQEIIRRIGEQKITLSNLINILTPYYNKPEMTELIDKLIDLNATFEQIQYKYEYIEPTTDAANKITTINSKSEVIITDEQLRQISEKVKGIRNQIIA